MISNTCHSKLNKLLTHSFISAALLTMVSHANAEISITGPQLVQQFSGHKISFNPAFSGGEKLILKVGDDIAAETSLHGNLSMKELKFNLRPWALKPYTVKAIRIGKNGSSEQSEFIVDKVTIQFTENQIRTPKYGSEKPIVKARKNKTLVTFGKNPMGLTNYIKVIEVTTDKGRIYNTISPYIGDGRLLFKTQENIGKATISKVELARKKYEFKNKIWSE